MHKILPSDVTIKKGKDGTITMDITNIVIEHPKGKLSESGKTLQFTFASTGKVLAIGDHGNGRITLRLEVPVESSKPKKKLW